MTLDGTEVFYPEAGRLFRANNFDESALHSITITQDGSEGVEMSVEQVNVAYE